MPASGAVTAGSNDLRERRRAQAVAKHEESQQQLVLLAEKQKKAKAAAAAADEARFQQHLSEVAATVKQRSGVLGDVEALLEAQQHIKSSKAQQLYHQWHEQVFDQIQDRLQERLSQRSPRDISARLHAASDAYVTACNQKVGVFRDVVIESDYDPMAPLAATIRIPTADICDPLEGDLLRTRLELQQLGIHQPSPHAPGKAVLEPAHWGAREILATPYGHCVAPDGAYVVQPASEAADKFYATHLCMDDYQVSHEPDFAVSGRRPPPHEAVATQVDLILHQRPVQAGEPVSGDLWLGHKGKKVVEGPGAKQGRRGLFDVMQQSSNPYKDGRSLGDAWLESAAGKKIVSGPEGRRDHANMFDVLQQKQQGLQRMVATGQPTGDMWLDARGRRTGNPNPPRKQK